MKCKTVKVGDLAIGQNKPLTMIAGPCVIENRSACMSIAKKLKAIASDVGVSFVFKASYDKANRSSIQSYRGPGLEKGLDILAEIRETLKIPVLTDVHSPGEAMVAADFVDIIQIPAFLCRQTDLLLAAGESGCVVNVKKAQFLAPWDMKHVINKLESTGNKNILITERGSTFGYNNLVVDMRSLIILRELGYPVVFDATHSVQLPGGEGARSGGNAEWAPDLARGAVAVGCQAVFMETHPQPEKALSDASSMIPLKSIRRVWSTLRSIHEVC
jgi:2-dehydro-3-deoxyphosphooctonate aldolase (KDO 8-P synthase)